MIMHPHLERETRLADTQSACTLYERIEQVLAEVRTSENATVIEAHKHIRSMMRIEFDHLRVIRSFTIHDEANFNEWHVRVQYPDGREVGISNDM